MIGKRCELCGHRSIVDQMCLNRKSLLYGTHRDDDDTCSCFCMMTATRQDLVDAWGGIDTVLCALRGKGKELTDKAAIIIMAKAIWIILNRIVRGIDKEGSK